MTNKQIDLLDRISSHPIMCYEETNEEIVHRLHTVSKEIHDEIGWLFEKFPYLGIFENRKKPILIITMAANCHLLF